MPYLFYQKLIKKLFEHCLLQAEIPALAVLCKSNDFERATFAALLKLRDNHHQGTTNFVDSIQRYESLDLATAQRVMRFLKVRKTADKLPQTNHEKTMLISYFLEQWLSMGTPTAFFDCLITSDVLTPATLGVAVSCLIIKS